MTNRTQKWNVHLLGHVPYTRLIVVEVPADWSDEDISRLSGRELANLTDDIDWEVELSVVVRDGIDLMDEASDDSVPDVTITGKPPAAPHDLRATSEEAADHRTNHIDEGGVPF